MTRRAMVLVAFLILAWACSFAVIAVRLFATLR
jgi:hypothetical protein